MWAWYQIGRNYHMAYYDKLHGDINKLPEWANEFPSPKYEELHFNNESEEATYNLARGIKMGTFLREEKKIK